MTLNPFVVGVSRSGTTLLRLMLDAHPEMGIPHETHFLPAMIAASPATPAEFIASLMAAQTWPDFHLDAPALLQRVSEIQPFSLGAAVELFYASYAEARGKPRWGDKTPPYILHIETISRLLPRARFIHIIRDVRDVALSLSDKWFGPGPDVALAAAFWRDRIVSAREQASRIPKDCYLELRYEDLITAPEKELRRIAGFIDLPFHSAMLNYHQQAEERLAEMADWRDQAGRVTIKRNQRLDIHRNTLRAPDMEQIGKWRSHYTVAEVKQFSEIAGPLMAQLGYER